MKALENVRIEGRSGTWYEIDRNETYILFESEEYGDEAGMILTDYQLNEVTETWDDLETTVAEIYNNTWLDPIFEDVFDDEVGFDPYMGCYSEDC